MTMIEVIFYISFFKVWVNSMETDESVIAFGILLFTVFIRFAYEIQKNL